jgi:hypothetical protein
MTSFSLHPVNRLCALEQLFALASVVCERCRTLEIGACPVEATEPGQQIAAHAGQEMVFGQRRLSGQLLDQLKPRGWAIGNG